MLRWKASTTYSGQAIIMFPGAVTKGLGKADNCRPGARSARPAFEMD